MARQRDGLGLTNVLAVLFVVLFSVSARLASLQRNHRIVLGRDFVVEMALPTTDRCGALYSVDLGVIQNSGFGQTVEVIYDGVHHSGP